MSALQEWYRYVDSLVRPSRQFEELEEWWIADDATSESAERTEAPSTSLHLDDHRGRPQDRAATAGSKWSDPAPGAPPPAHPTPVPAVSVDPRAVVARLAAWAEAETAEVAWAPVRTACPVPELAEFIPNLDASPGPGAAARAFLEAIARSYALLPPAPAAPVAEKPADQVAPLSAETAVARPAIGDARADLAVSKTRLPAPIAASSAPHAAGLPPALPPTAASAIRVAIPTRELAPRPDLPTIESIREGLPRTVERLLQIPITEEVAQNSYKSPFRESREELIRRLFDPQLTLEEAARVLGVCPTTVRRYTNKGLLRHHRTQGNQRRFRLSDLLGFLERWGDAGPDAGALGGVVSSKKNKSAGRRPPRAAPPGAEGSADAAQNPSISTSTDPARTDSG